MNMRKMEDVLKQKTSKTVINTMEGEIWKAWLDQYTIFLILGSTLSNYISDHIFIMRHMD